MRRQPRAVARLYEDSYEESHYEESRYDDFRHEDSRYEEREPFTPAPPVG